MLLQIRAREDGIGLGVCLPERVHRHHHGRGVDRVVAQYTGERLTADGGQLGRGELPRAGVEEPVRPARARELLPHQTVEGGAEDGADHRLLHVAGEVQLDVGGAAGGGGGGVAAVGDLKAANEVGGDEVGEGGPRGVITVVIA